MSVIRTAYQVFNELKQENKWEDPYDWYIQPEGQARYEMEERCQEISEEQ